MKYPLFFSDFDGTLVRDDGIVSERNIQAIKRYQKEGGRFAVCTGRAPVSILPRVRGMGMTEGLVVSFHGATVTDIKTGEHLKNDGFTDDEARRLVKELEAGGKHFHMYTADHFYCNFEDEFLHMYEKVVGVKGIIEPNLSERIERENLRVVKLLFMMEPKDCELLRKELSEAFGDEFYVTASSTWLVEIMPKHVNKAQGVKFVADYYAIPLEKVAVIGDQLNDIPMLEIAGGKFAPANAQDEVKELATVVSSHEEDGVAEAIEKYAMGE